MNWRISLCEPDLGADEEAAVLRVLQSKWLSLGPEVQAFEQEFAAVTQTKFALAVSSATAALHLSLLALEIEPGAEVIQPALSFVAAANMTRAVGAIPVFADVQSLAEPTLCPASVERLITPRTRAVLAMHYGGYPCAMHELRRLCEQHSIALIEDACHAIGAQLAEGDPTAGRKVPVGALGDVACFSFFSNKNLATGEGGMLTTNRADLAASSRLLRSHGMSTLTWDRHQGHASGYDVTRVGYNFRLDELRAAIGRVQLAKLNTNNAKRGALVAAYQQRFKKLPNWIVPFDNYQGDSAYHLMVAVAPSTQVRDRVREHLKLAGIQTSLHYPCIADFSCYRDSRSDALAVTREFAAGALTLPLYPHLTLAQVDEIMSQIESAA